MLKEFRVSTSKKQELVDITGKIKEIVRDSDIKSGICIVYVPHATAGIIINENYDPSVCNDILNKLEQIAPQTDRYEHDKIDNNAHSHIKASIIGPSQTIIMQNNELLLGTWQGIALAEFDGPKTRTVFVKIIED
ncbi:MAG: secondary thiamine-phosphate synthase enzyme YjbQ [Nitrosopumilus sp.]